MLRLHHTIFAVLSLLLIAAWAPGAVQAAPPEQPPGLSMQVTAGYDSNYKVGEWFPVQVLLANDGPSFTGRVEIDARGDNGTAVSKYAQDVELPSPSRKQITLYSYSTSFQRDFSVRLVQGNAVVKQQAVKLSSLEEPAFLLGVVGGDAALLNELTNANIGRAASTPAPPWQSTAVSSGAIRTTVAHLTLDNIAPSAEGLAGLDALIFAGVDTGKLSQEQITAINGWVVRGGSLVVAGGPNAAATAGAFTNLLPVRLTGSRQSSDFTALTTLVKQGAALSGTAIFAVSQPLPDSGATVLAGDAAAPLLAQRSLGLGHVFFLALDPSIAPLKGWDATAQLWQTVFAKQDVGLSSGGWRRLQDYYGYAPFDTGGTPFDIPALDLPATGLVALFLLIYILAVGPLNYIVLKRMGRSELAWITIPALILVFAVGAYLFGRQSRGASLYLTQGNVIKTYPDSNMAAVESFVGVFSPDRRVYDVRIGGNAQVSEISANGYGASTANNEATILQTNPVRLDKLSLDTWTLRGFLAESTVAYNSPYQTTLAMKDGHVNGTLTNRSQNALDDVVIISSGNIQRVGHFAPGQMVTVDIRPGLNRFSDTLMQQIFPNLPQYSYSSGQTAETRAAQRRASILASGLFDEEASAGSEVHVVIAGWGAPSPLPVEVDGNSPQRDELNLVLTTVAVDLGSGQVTVPGALIKRKVINGDVTEGSNGTANASLFNIVYSYALPTDLKVDTLTLDYKASGMSSDVPVYMFNWQTNDWDEIKRGNGALLQGIIASGTLELPTASQHVSPSGEVQLRIGDKDYYVTNIEIDNFDISAKGRR